MTETIQVLKATLENINDVSKLFSNYRKFYGIDSNETESKNFIEARIRNNESVVFIAYDNHIPCGFTQLYFSFSSLSISPIIILNDLYVTEEYREKGIATQLLNIVKDFAKTNAYSTIILSTSKLNTKAQSLYEKEGYKVDHEFLYYYLGLNS